MVKGISRQVIVVQGAEPRLFEQAIFILKDEALKEGVTDDLLLKEAQSVIRERPGRRQLRLYGAVWAAAGALATGGIWLVTALL